VTTNDKLFRYANVDPEKADDATKETLRYRSALLRGYQDIQRRPLTTNVAISVCRAHQEHRIGYPQNARNRASQPRYLRELTAGGILESRKEGREQLYMNSRFLDLLMSDANEFRAFGTP
jgi:hypothetical protein